MPRGPFQCLPRVYNHSPRRIGTCHLKPSTIHCYTFSITFTSKIILHAHPLTMWSQEMHALAAFRQKAPGGGGGFGMTPWCDDLVCSWRRLLADRHSLPFPWTLSLHRRWCPSASHHPLTFLFLLALTFPLPSPFPSLGLSLCRPPCPSASPHSFPSLSLGRLCQRSPRTCGGGGGA